MLLVFSYLPPLGLSFHLPGMVLSPSFKPSVEFFPVLSCPVSESSFVPAPRSPLSRSTPCFMGTGLSAAPPRVLIIVIAKLPLPPASFRSLQGPFIYFMSVFHFGGFSYLLLAIDECLLILKNETVKSQ